MNQSQLLPKALSLPRGHVPKNTKEYQRIPKNTKEYQRIPKNTEVLTRVLDDLLEHRDPQRKAKRADNRTQQRQQKMDQDHSHSESVVPGRTAGKTPDPETVAPVDDPTAKKPRSAIPMAVRHEIWIRDEGRCT